MKCEDLAGFGAALGLFNPVFRSSIVAARGRVQRQLWGRGRMKRSAFKDVSRVGLWAAFFALPGASQNAFAVENVQNFYILGQRAALAGVTPPPGLYFQDPVYFYSAAP
jgi:hypothetical protein